MDHIRSKESDIEIDLESGGTTSDEDGSFNHDLTGETFNKELYKAGSGFCGVQLCNGSIRNQDGSNTYNKMLSDDELSVRCTEIWSNKVGQEIKNLGDNKMDIEKTRKPKPPKPPRPPKGPSLDASDVKFVKEISELAIWKRRRTERIKALKKIKKESGPYSKMNILAMVITILFFLIIIFQDQGFVDLESQEELTSPSKIMLNLLANSGCLLYRNATTTMDFVKGSLKFVGALKQLEKGTLITCPWEPCLTLVLYFRKQEV